MGYGENIEMLCFACQVQLYFLILYQFKGWKNTQPPFTPLQIKYQLQTGIIQKRIELLKLFSNCGRVRWEAFNRNAVTPEEAISSHMDRESELGPKVAMIS
jgi:hypothetical protein